jgi:hypothetical protein
MLRLTPDLQLHLRTLLGHPPGTRPLHIAAPDPLPALDPRPITPLALAQTLGALTLALALDPLRITALVKAYFRLRIHLRIP